jgi:restriction endonuclease Mrr
MRTLIDPKSPDALDAPPSYLQRALVEDKQLLRIVWDEADGYPEHAWGYVEWSLRPYEQYYGCDGTTTENINLIGYRLCSELGLDYPALYEQAYADKDHIKPGQSWLRELTAKDWAAIETETIVPELSETALRGLLHDLEEINYHQLVSLLEDTFTELGYNVERYWERCQTN